MNYTTTAYAFYYQFVYNIKIKTNQNLGAVYIIESEMFTFLTGASKIIYLDFMSEKVTFCFNYQNNITCRKKRKKWFISSLMCKGI